MKILLTINDISITGGAERVCVNLANALSELGHQVSVLSFYRANAILPYRLSESVNLHIWHNIAEAEYAKKRCGNFFSKMYYKNIYKFILSLQVSKKFSHFDVIISNCATYTPFFKYSKTRYCRIIHLNFSKYHSRNNYFNSLVILSSIELSTWQSYHKNIKVIPNFLPFISAKNTDSNQHRIISVGRMDRGDQKGFLRLIDIWEKVQERIKATYSHTEQSEVANTESKKDISCLYTQYDKITIQNDSHKKNLESWQLVIVGDGAMKEQIQAKILEKNLQDTITLKPFTKDIEKKYLNASIYAMTSHFEGFGMVLVEASSYALPCIAFDIAAGPSDIIESGVSGYLIKDNDLQDYADKLFTLMSDKDKRESMGLQAKQRVKEKFSKEAIMPLWEEVFRDESI